MFGCWENGWKKGLLFNTLFPFPNISNDKRKVILIKISAYCLMSTSFYFYFILMFWNDMNSVLLFVVLFVCVCFNCFTLIFQFLYVAFISSATLKMEAFKRMATIYWSYITIYDNGSNFFGCYIQRWRICTFSTCKMKMGHSICMVQEKRPRIALDHKFWLISQWVSVKCFLAHLSILNCNHQKFVYIKLKV